MHGKGHNRWTSCWVWKTTRWSSHIQMGILQGFFRSTLMLGQSRYLFSKKRSNYFIIFVGQIQKDHCYAQCPLWWVKLVFCLELEDILTVLDWIYKHFSLFQMKKMFLSPKISTSERFLIFSLRFLNSTGWLVVS